MHMFQLGQLALDMTFPFCALSKLNDKRVHNNDERLRELHGTSAFEETDGVWFWAGSQAEGLAVDKGWGHDKADVDIMKLFGGRSGVFVPSDITQPNDALLVCHIDKYHREFCRVEVRNVNLFLKMVANGCWQTNNGPFPGSKSKLKKLIVREGKVPYLDVQYILEQFCDPEFNISGPTLQVWLDEFELAPTLVCSSPHPDLVAFSQRKRIGWPSETQINFVKSLSMLLVFIGPKFVSVPNLMRVSSSHIEYYLISSLPYWVKQGYVAFKYSFKVALKSRRTGHIEGCDRRKHICSYHLKNTLLHHLECKPPHVIRSSFNLMIDLLNDLHYHLRAGKLVHYILPHCNLFENVDVEERECALNTTQEVLENPWLAILRSPVRPLEIYGLGYIDPIVNICFEIQSGTQTFDGFKRLLQHVEDHIKAANDAQSREDIINKISGRPGPPKLVK